MAKLDLHKNTIGDFHRNLMDYYAQAGEKHKRHSGEFVKHIGNFTVPEFNIDYLKVKDRTILRDRNWGSKAEWRDYMMSKGYNKVNTTLKMVEAEDLPSKIILILDKIDIK